MSGAGNRDREELRLLAMEYVYGEMEPAARRAFEDALAADPELKAEVAAFQALRSRLSEVPDPEPPAHLVADILAMADQACVDRTRRRSWSSLFQALLQPQVGLGLAALVVVAVGIYIMQEADKPMQPGSLESARKEFRAAPSGAPAVDLPAAVPLEAAAPRPSPAAAAAPTGPAPERTESLRKQEGEAAGGYAAAPASAAPSGGDTVGTAAPASAAPSGGDTVGTAASASAAPSGGDTVGTAASASAAPSGGDPAGAAALAEAGPAAGTGTAEGAPAGAAGGAADARGRKGAVTVGTSGWDDQAHGSGGSGVEGGGMRLLDAAASGQPADLKSPDSGATVLGKDRAGLLTDGDAAGQDKSLERGLSEEKVNKEKKKSAEDWNVVETVSLEKPEREERPDSSLPRDEGGFWDAPKAGEAPLANEESAAEARQAREEPVVEAPPAPAESQEPATKLDYFAAPSKPAAKPQAAPVAVLAPVEKPAPAAGAGVPAGPPDAAPARMEKMEAAKAPAEDFESGEQGPEPDMAQTLAAADDGKKGEKQAKTEEENEKKTADPCDALWSQILALQDAGKGADALSLLASFKSGQCKGSRSEGLVSLKEGELLLSVGQPARAKAMLEKAKEEPAASDAAEELLLDMEE